MKSIVLSVATLLAIAGGGYARGIEMGKEYAVHDDIPVVATKIGPISNPSETYPYYSLPFCEPEGGVQRQAHGLGEVLAGDHKVRTKYELSFRADVSWRRLCRKVLTKADISKLVSLKSSFKYSCRMQSTCDLAAAETDVETNICHYFRDATVL